MATAQDFDDYRRRAGDEAVRASVMAARTVGTEETSLRLIDPALWLDQDVPPRQWAVAGWIPRRQATLLTGKGGVGKSLLAQQLCTCIALGLPFLGLETEQRAALYLSCEDDIDELHRRQKAICAGLGVTVAALSGKLHLASLSGEIGNELATFDQSENLIVGNRYREVEAAVKVHRLGFVALDNASHLMAGDHNSLHQVAAFLGLLNRLALACNGSTLILHHPNKAGDDWLGSVAWENQVRSRIKMQAGDTPGDNDTRFLENAKANYAPLGSRVDFRWYQGAFRMDDDLPDGEARDLSANIAANFDNEVFLSCLRVRNGQLRAVSERRSPTFAPSVFAGMPEAKGVGKKRLEAAMDRLFRIAAIERGELWKGDDRKMIFGLRETAK